MSKIILDPELKAKLNGLNEQLEVCDESGRTVGRFLPEKMFQEFLVAWADAHLSDEEIEQARQEFREHGGMTTQDAIQFLHHKIEEMKGPR